jgi:hypothetical protein
LVHPDVQEAVRANDFEALRAKAVAVMEDMAKSTDQKVQERFKTLVEADENYQMAVHSLKLKLKEAVTDEIFKNSSATLIKNYKKSGSYFCYLGIYSLARVLDTSIAV